MGLPEGSPVSFKALSADGLIFLKKTNQLLKKKRIQFRIDSKIERREPAEQPFSFSSGSTETAAETDCDSQRKSTGRKK